MENSKGCSLPTAANMESRGCPFAKLTRHHPPRGDSSYREISLHRVLHKTAAHRGYCTVHQGLPVDQLTLLSAGWCRSLQHLFNRSGSDRAPLSRAARCAQTSDASEGERHLPGNLIICKEGSACSVNGLLERTGRVLLSKNLPPRGVLRALLKYAGRVFC